MGYYDDNVYFDLVVNRAENYINLIAQADPSDPIVKATREKLEQLQNKIWGGVFWVELAVGEGLLLWILYGFGVASYFPIPGLILAGLIAAICYGVVGVVYGTICEQAYGEMQYRQSHDIHEMRLQADRDREAY